MYNRNSMAEVLVGDLLLFRPLVKFKHKDGFTNTSPPRSQRRVEHVPRLPTVAPFFVGVNFLLVFSILKARPPTGQPTNC
jgi:hypothetical protein